MSHRVLLKLTVERFARVSDDYRLCDSLCIHRASEPFGAASCSLVLPRESIVDSARTRPCLEAEVPS